MKKRIISLIFACLLALSLSIVRAGAASAGSQVRYILEADRTSAKAGETVNYMVSLAPCEHIQATQVTLSIPDGLIYQEGGKAAPGIVDTLGAAMAGYADEGLTFASFGLGDYSSKTPTLLFSFSCKVSDTAKAGESLKVDAAYTEAVDPDDELLDTVFVNDDAAVTVIGSSGGSASSPAGGSDTDGGDQSGISDSGTSSGISSGGALPPEAQTDENGEPVGTSLPDGSAPTAADGTVRNTLSATGDEATGISPWIFVLIGIAVILIAAVIIYFIHQSKSKDNKEKEKKNG